jgi:hypothetical protein
MSTLNANKQNQPSSTKTEPLKNISAEGNYDGETRLNIDQQSRLSDTFGRINLENAATKYVGSAHWEAILDGVCSFGSFQYVKTGV